MNCRTRWITIMRFLSLLLISLALAGCGSFTDYNSPALVSISPSPDALIQTTNLTEIRLEFSKPMNRESVEKALTVKKLVLENFNETTIEGRCTWSGTGNASTVIFQPLSNFTFGKYRVTLQENAEDSAGININDSTNWTFSIGNDTELPCIVSTFPATGGVITTNDFTPAITFSEPVDSSSLQNIFSVSPGFSFIVEAYSNNAFFLLRPLETIPDGQYVLTINQVYDRFGNQSRDTETIFFTVGNDFTPPELTGIYLDSNLTQPLDLSATTNCLDKFQCLYFTFSEGVQWDTANPKVSFSPSADGRWQQISTNLIQFKPSKYWALEQTYTMTVNSGIKDFAANTSLQTVRAQFFIQTADSQYLNLTQSLQCTNETASGITWEIAVLNTLSNTSQILIDLIFSQPIQYASVPEAFTLTYIAGGGSRAAYISDLRFISNSASSNAVRLTILSNDANIYKLTIKGGEDGVKDIHSNWMKTSKDIYYESKN